MVPCSLSALCRHFPLKEAGYLLQGKDEGYYLKNKNGGQLMRGKPFQGSVSVLVKGLKCVMMGELNVHAWFADWESLRPAKLNDGRVLLYGENMAVLIMHLLNFRIRNNARQMEQK